MNVFDIIGPIMIGPSSSHTAGAVRLGRVANKLMDGQTPARLDITLSGSFARTGRGHGTDRALLAGIMGYHSYSEEIRDALAIASGRGIDYRFIRRDIPDTHPNTARVEYVLPNGERRPTLDEYLTQTEKCTTTKLVIEFKKQASPEREALMVEKTIAQLKEHKLYTPERVLFISFSKFICEKIAAEHPQFVNQFLSADPILDEDPAIYAAKGINGVDYHYKMFKAHPEWVRKAHSLGMSVNAWTVNKEEDIKKMIEVGVDAITTNEPLLVRDLLSIEYKKK